MRLGVLLSALPAARLPEGDFEEEINALVCDSRRAKRGSLFVCLRGPERDGHAYAQDAYARGCRVFVCEYPPTLPDDARLIYVHDSRAALADLASAWYGYPERELTLIGITGTKGKTTTAVMIWHLLRAAGIPVGYIGSGGVWYAGVEEQTENTTPSAPELRRAFAAMRRAGVRCVVMEVSSQAICSARVAGLVFSICLFTNLAEDHIGDGEHPDFCHYRDAKARLFSDYGCRSMIVNLDDKTAPYMMAEACAPRVLTISCNRRDATVYADRIRHARQGAYFGTAFFLHSDAADAVPVSLSLPGECNVSNALLALCAAREYLLQEAPGTDASYRALAHPLAAVTVPGRFEPVPTAMQDVDFLIDYAHNGYSLCAAITALRAYAPARLVCLFGSVGERTYSRRAELARAACGADFCIVTADNPGTEPPEETMREICAVLEENRREYVAILDREEAIRYAVRHARPGDLVLLAGKGHEDYQLIDSRRLPFSERAILTAAAEERESILLF